MVGAHAPVYSAAHVNVLVYRNALADKQQFVAG